MTAPTEWPTHRVKARQRHRNRKRIARAAQQAIARGGLTPDELRILRGQ